MNKSLLICEICGRTNAFTPKIDHDENSHIDLAVWGYQKGLSIHLLKAFGPVIKPKTDQQVNNELRGVLYGHS